MKKLGLNALLLIMMLCVFNFTGAAAQPDDIVFDSENMCVSYENNNLEATADGIVYLVAYESDKLVGIDAWPVKKGTNEVSLSATVTETPDMAKMMSFGSELLPIAEIITKDLTVPEYDFSNLVDFTVEVEEGRDAIVLQLTDPQSWNTHEMEEKSFRYMRKTIEETNPDFIIITGDLVYGSFDPNGEMLLALIDFMDSFKIPWAPVFGNHDNECELGVDWQCEQLENSDYCLFKQRTLTGNGNYTVGIVQGGELKRVFFMMDSNGCTGMSDATAANGHSTTSTGFGNDQIAWFEETGAAIKESCPDVKISFAFHIQLYQFETAYLKYGYSWASEDLPVNIDLADNKADSDFGFIGAILKGPWDYGRGVYDRIKRLGADSIFVGHEHSNNASVVYDGIRFQFGQKSSTYDRANYADPDVPGAVRVGSYEVIGIPLIGGTVIPLSKEDASINNAYIYYCEDVVIDRLPDDTEISGFPYGEALTADDTLTVYKAKVAGEKAYKAIANEQGKIYVGPYFIENKDTFSFSAYLPSDSSAKLEGLGEFAIKINDSEYISFSSDSADDKTKVVFDEWKTYTVDISEYSSDCTEFAFAIPEGNAIYFKDGYVDGEILSTDVKGLQYGTDLTPQNDYITVEKVLKDRYAYEVTATKQSKLIVNPELLANKDKFTFSVFLPETSTNKISGKGEFTIRVKGATGPLVTSGYILYDTSATDEELKLVPGEWKTYTIDISGYGTSCTEFSFQIAKGNTIYLAGLMIE